MRKLVPLLCLALLATGASDCGEDPNSDPGPAPSPAPAPAPAPARSPTPTPSPSPGTSPRLSPAPTPSGYPLNGQQAYEAARAGRAVGGYTPNGEVQVARGTITVNERRPIQKCANEYDFYSQDYEYKCKTVYELEKVPKTVYFATGPRGQPTKQFDNIAGAFAYAAQDGVTAWRLVP